jgi:catechol 2,3-dioxygenase-like lactoylglutathione lyase family enzyme
MAELSPGINECADRPFGVRSKLPLRSRRPNKKGHALTSRLTEVSVDCRDVDRLVAFWCAVLGYERTEAGDNWVSIGPPGRETSDDQLRTAARAPVMTFAEVPEGKVVKNRVHVDVTPVDSTRDEEVDRLIGLGAARADVGQGETSWTVMVDPESNEFCVMRGLGEEQRDHHELPTLLTVSGGPAGTPDFGDDDTPRMLRLLGIDPKKS